MILRRPTTYLSCIFFMKDIHGLLLYLNYRNSESNVTKTRFPHYIRSSVFVIYFWKAPWNFKMSVMFTHILKAPQILYVMRLTRHMLRRQLLRHWYLSEDRVRLMGMIGFLVEGRVRIRIRIRVRVRVRVYVSFIVVGAYVMVIV